jgi:protein gp37
MAANSKIEWCQATWNPVTGCMRVSEGCRNCYAERLTAGRLAHLPQYAGLTRNGRWTGEVRCHEAALDEPLHWRKPRMVFVCSMADLFHEDVPFEFITRVFDAMCSWRWPSKLAQRRGDQSDLVNPGHTYQVLTKRPARIMPWLEWVDHSWPGDSPFNVSREGGIPRHIWLGASCEDQPAADERVPNLRGCPAAVRFVSCEPLLAPTDLTPWLSATAHGHCEGCVGHRPLDDTHCEGTIEHPGPAALNWVIVGGESGPGARPMSFDLVRSIRDQCAAARVPLFVKQLTADGRKLPFDEWPGDLKIREYPR